MTRSRIRVDIALESNACVVDRGPPDSVAMFDAAINAAVQLTQELTSEIAELADVDGTCSRCELERALSRAQVAAERFPEAVARAQARHQLQKMRAVANLMFATAPAPSSTAIEAAEAVTTTWHQEEQAWIVGRLASGARARSVGQRTYRDPRNDARPEPNAGSAARQGGRINQPSSKNRLPPARARRVPR